MTNEGLSGNIMVQFARNKVFYHSIGTDENYTFLTGMNDLRANASDAGHLATYDGLLRACAVWCSIPDTDKLIGQDAGLTFSAGDWTVHSLYGGTDNSNTTSTDGATITATLHGTAIYICYSNLSGQGDGGTITINVDGVDVSTIDLNVGNVAPVSFADWPELIRVGGLADTAHTVIVTANIIGAQRAIVNWFADNHSVVAGYPRVYVGNVVRLTATGYALNDPDWDNAGDADVAAYNVVNAAVASDLISDGLNVHYVDIYSSYDPNLYVFDNLHPNPAGHVMYAKIFLNKMAHVP
jgi:hypothetical protein